MTRTKKPKEGSSKEAWIDFISKKEDVRKKIRSMKDYINAVKGIQVKPIDDPFSPVEIKKVLTGTALDRILSRSGGIEAGSSLMIWGEFATGKTQIINSMIIEAALSGLVILIDSEGTYRRERLIEISKERGVDPSKISSNIRVYQPVDWIEQEAVVYNLPEFDDEGEFLEVSLVALDSLMKTFTETKEFQGRENMGQRAGIIAGELAEIQRYCRRHNAVFVFSNQVREIPDVKFMAPPEKRVYPPGGPTVRHFPDYNVFLRKGPRNVRYARLIDSPDLPLMEVPFILSKGGIRDIPDAAERVVALELAEKYDKKYLSGQVGMKPAPKSNYKKALLMGAVTVDEVKEHGWLTQEEIDTVLAQIEDSKDKQNTISDIASEELDEEEFTILAMEEEYPDDE